MTRHTEGRRSHCPISFALDVLGDRWTLLVMRDLLLRGKSSFGEFLASEEGIATNVLADRLAWLERQGLVTKARDPRERRRVVYRATRKGLDVLPIMLDMVLWSARHDPDTAAPSLLVRRIARDREGVIRAVAAGRTPQPQRGKTPRRPPVR